MNRAEPVELRPATAGDADFIAWGLDEAAGGLFATMFGRRAPTILGRVVTEPVHSFSLEHAVVAEQDASPVGFCSGFPYGTPDGSDALLRAAGIRALRAGVVALLGRPALRALDRRGPGQWYLQAIAVRPQARGAGVGQVLFANAFERAAAARLHTLTLDVDAANIRARALYERLGLQVQSTSGRAVLLGGVQVLRMSAPVERGTI